MQALNFKMLTPWNLSPVHPIYLGEMCVNKRTLNSITFTEIASRHKSPTIGVSLDDIRKEAKANNKYLKVSSYATSDKPLRPDLSDIEVALIHATWGNIPVSHMAETLNITETRLRQIRKATEPLYKQADTPLPSLPLITITDTSRYWTDEEVLEAYDLDPKITEGLSDGISKPSDILAYKDLLRGLKRKSQNLDFPINSILYNKEDNKDSVFNRATLPIEVPWQDEEGYRDLSNILWTYVSREDKISGKLSFTDWNPDNPVIHAPVSYKSSLEVKGKLRILDHEHREGHYNPPLNIPKPIIKLCVDIINDFINKNILPPSLENLTLHLLSSFEYTSNRMNVKLKTPSSKRGHCLPFKKRKDAEETPLSKGKPSVNLGYYVDSPPLVCPKFDSKTYNYGIICHECNTFLSNNTVNECKHLKFEVYSTINTPKLPLIYLYSPLISPDYSLYYYNLTQNGDICSVFTLNLLQFYSNFSIPVHKVPFEA